MEELKNIDRKINKLAVHSEKKQKQEVEYTFNESIRPYKGHLVFEINELTLEINEAEGVRRNYITWEDAIKSMNGGYKKEILIRKDCVYISALNKESAMKRYFKNKGSAVIISEGLKIN